MLLALRVEPEREEVRQAGHDHVGHQRHHHRGRDQRAHQGREQIQPVAEQGEDDRDDREDPEPGDDAAGASLWLRDPEEMGGGER